MTLAREYKYEVNEHAFQRTASLHCGLFHSLSQAHHMSIWFAQVHHKLLVEKCMGGDFTLAGCLTSWILATHYGNLTVANSWMDRMLELVQQLFDDPNQSEQALTKALLPMMYVNYAVMVGREEQCLPCLELIGLDWHTADSLADKAAEESPLWLRKRGDT